MSAAAALALTLAAAGPAQRPVDAPQEVFARAALAALAAGDEGALADRVRQAPYRAANLVLDLLRQAARGESADWARASAGRLAAAAEAQGFPAAAGAVAAYDPLAWSDLAAAETAANEAAARADWPAARRAAEDALGIAVELGTPLLEARLRRLAGRIALDRGDLDAARDALERARRLDEELDAPDALARDLAALGRLTFLRGRYAEAVESYEGARSAAAAAGEPAPPIDADLAALYANLARHDEAERALERALERARAEGDVRAEAYALGVRATVAGSRGRYGAALDDARAAVELARASGDPLAEARAERLLGGLASEAGRLADAADAFGRALERSGPGTLEGAEARLGLALVRSQEGAAREALPLVESALAAFDDAGHAAGRVDALALRARLLAEAGRAAEAAAALRDVRERRLAARDAFGAAAAGVELGAVLLGLGRAEDARAAFDAALAGAQPIGAGELAWRAHAGLARLEEAAGRAEAALEHDRAALREIEASRSELGGARAARGFGAGRIEPYRHAARLLGRAGRLDEAFVRAEEAKARTLLEIRATGPLDVPAAVPELAALDGARVELRTAELRLGDALRRGEDEATRADLAARRDEARERCARARLDAELAAPRRSSVRGDAGAAELGAVAARLPPGVLLLEYVVGAQGSGVLAARAGSARYLDLGLGADELGALVERLHRPLRDLRAGRVDGTNLRFDAAAARALFDALLAPLGDALVPGEPLWIVPDGPLWELPFALLVTGGAARPVDPTILYAQYEGLRFLVEDHALVQLPAAGLLVHDAAPDGDRGSGALALAATDPPPGAPRLPAAERELAALERLGTTRSVLWLAGREATERAWARHAPAAAWLHLAAHGELDGRRPELSRIALAPGGGEDGWLHAFEVERVPLAASRVVLSACDGAGTEVPGEGLLGLARAFLEAGARSVVASLWSVDDEATGSLMEAYYAALGEGAGAPEALRRAQVATLRSRRPGVSLANPFFWAAFVHVGAP